MIHIVYCDTHYVVAGGILTSSWHIDTCTHTPLLSSYKADTNFLLGVRVLTTRYIRSFSQSLFFAHSVSSSLTFPSLLLSLLVFAHPLILYPYSMSVPHRESLTRVALMESTPIGVIRSDSFTLHPAYKQGPRKNFWAVCTISFSLCNISVYSRPFYITIFEYI
jgi:hypothetical protein